jgi:tocopherol cyclase
MRRFLRSIRHPERYHGRLYRPPFFEGWYYKLIDAPEQHRYAIIPGVFVGQDVQSSHAFVQVLDGTTGRATYHPYPIEAFQAAEGDLDVQIGPNRFRQDRISLHIESAERTIAGEARFTGLIPWPVTLASPGVMGWYAWVPFMECYHGVLSFDHAIEGSLSVDGAVIDWSGGRGYIEKDWGRSFPKAWIWAQTNHFGQPGTSLTLSVAVIPWLGSAFRGLIAGLWHEGTLYRFATYTGAQIESIQVAENSFALSVSDRTHNLKVRGQRSQSGVLRGPSGTDMGVRVPETLLAEIQVTLWQHDSEERSLLFEGTGRNGGMEIVGELQRLR